MIQVVDFRDDQSEAWRAYVGSREDATVCHMIEWREIIHASLGHKPYYLLAKRNGQVCGVVPLFLVTTWWRSRYLISIPWLDYGGILADDEDVERALLVKTGELAKALSAKFVEMRSIKARTDETKHRTDKVTFVLELSSGEEAVWKGFDAKLRNQVRKAEKSELVAEFGREELLDDFYAVFTRNMRDLGTPVWGRDLFERCLTVLPRNAELVIVRLRGRAIAGGLVLSFRDTLYVPSASSYRSERALCPNHSLYWETIKRGISNGYTHFDFGRSTLDGPTYNFKKQWTPHPIQLTWQYQLTGVSEIPALNPDNDRYNLAIRIWQKLPLPIANILGPRVIKNFP